MQALCEKTAHACEFTGDYLSPMDVLWFKKMQKQAGVSTEDIARLRGLGRSSVSKIYNGSQKMSLDWAKAFAQAFNVTVAEVLDHADPDEAAKAPAREFGFSEGDAVPFSGQGNDAYKTREISKHMGGGRPGIDAWTVTGTGLILDGYQPGDTVLVDTNRASSARAGDVVLAQRYDMQSGTAQTILRRFEPPVLISASLDPNERRVDIVDGTNVLIRGKVISSWRTL